jgi:uncharacterized protein YggT (Ycf19 family)
MSILDLTSALAVVVLTVLRFGMIWLLGQALKRVAPSTS